MSGLTLAAFVRLLYPLAFPLSPPRERVEDKAEKSKRRLILVVKFADPESNVCLSQGLSDVCGCFQHLVFETAYDSLNQ